MLDIIIGIILLIFLIAFNIGCYFLQETRYERRINDDGEKIRKQF